MNPEYLHYFAYGSNMHPLRLGERVPSCEPLSLASIAGYQLRFHKRGQDGSAKCNLFYTGNSQDRVYGVVFRMLSRERKRLDEAEGLGKGYNIHQVTVQAVAADCPVFCYIAEDKAIDNSLKPFDWYKALVLRAAEYHRFPDDYIESIRLIVTRTDPDPIRTQHHMRLAQKL